MLRPDPPRDNALRKPAVFWSLAAAAVALRLLCMSRPANYDQESWNIVADLVLDGKNVYANTHRYNYGPVWMYVIGALKWMAGDAYFRLAVCLLLCAIDVGTAALLRFRRLHLVAVLFLFSPWTIFITGHHHMFDNAAVLVGLLAVTWIEGRPGMRDGKQQLSALSIRDTLVGAAIIGCSLILKHVLWIFPLWMAFRTRDWTRRILWVAVPLGMFAVSFVPYWSEGRENILARVVHYTASSNAPMFNMLAPNIVDILLGCGPHLRLPRVVFGGALILAGMLIRRRTLFECFVMYLLFLVLLSSGIYNHFLVIPVLFTLLHRNVWGALYHLLAIPYYFVHHLGFNFGSHLPVRLKGAYNFAETYGHHLFLALLLACYLAAFWRGEIRRVLFALKARALGSLRGHQ